MSSAVMTLDARDGNWQSLARQLVAMSSMQGTEAQLLCPDDLQFAAGRLVRDLGLEDRVSLESTAQAQKARMEMPAQA